LQTALFRLIRGSRNRSSLIQFVLLSHGIEILLPFHGKHMLLLVITFLAGRHTIPLGRSAASDERHYMVHGQLLYRKCLAAIVATALCEPPLPPWRMPHLSCLGTLYPDLSFAHFRYKIVHDIIALHPRLRSDFVHYALHDKAPDLSSRSVLPWSALQQALMQYRCSSLSSRFCRQK